MPCAWVAARHCTSTGWTQGGKFLGQLKSNVGTENRASLTHLRRTDIGAVNWELGWVGKRPDWIPVQVVTVCEGLGGEENIGHLLTEVSLPLREPMVLLDHELRVEALPKGSTLLFFLLVLPSPNCWGYFLCVASVFFQFIGRYFYLDIGLSELPTVPVKGLLRPQRQPRSVGQRLY